MKRKVMTTLMVILAAIAIAQAQTVYTADAAASKLAWTGEKITGEHTGNIALKSGTFTLKNAKIVAGEYIIDMGSIASTDMEGEMKQKLEGHLKSEDFFGVEKYPEARIVLKSSSQITKGKAKVKADLTIKGTTLPIEFEAIFHDLGQTMNVYAIIVIDRTKFNIRYGSGSFFDNLGDKTIYDDFTVKLTIVSAKK